jgi:hypothetical protein
MVTYRRNVLLLISAVGLMLVLGLLLPQESWSGILMHPWRTLWGSGQQLNATLIEASEGDVASVSRRLLKPFGAVTLTCEYDADEKSKR